MHLADTLQNIFQPLETYIPRFQAIEFHEHPLFPPFLRQLLQDALAVLLTDILRAYESATEPLSRVLTATNTYQILDLCSGGALPAVDLCRRVLANRQPLPQKSPPKFTLYLSDLYPNLHRFKLEQQRYPDIVQYIPYPVDALHVSKKDQNWPRVRTLFTSLHHFQPADVKSLLEDVVENADGIAIFESSQRSFLAILGSFFVVYVGMMVSCSFLLRPWQFWHVVFGFLIPLVPFFGALDGFISCLRSYRPSELMAIVESIPGAREKFEWEVGLLDSQGLLRFSRGTYLIGYRSKAKNNT